MNLHLLAATVIVASGILLAACGGANDTPSAKAPAAAEPSTAASQSKAAPQSEAAAPAAKGWSGKVLDSMNSGGYTYVNVETGEGSSVWAAGPQSEIKVGDKVHIPEGMLMSNFESKTLGRTFEQIYFVPVIHVGDGPMPSADFPTNMMGKMPEGHPDLSGMMPEGHPNTAEPQMPEGHPDISTMMAANHPDPKKPAEGDAKAPVDLSGIEKAEGGLLIAEVFEKKDELVDKEVTLRAKVVKYNENILGKNWIHLRDGSGGEGTNDLTITTSDKAAVGDLVLVKGTLRANRDFGFGYKYDLMVESAVVTVEKAK